MKRDMNLIREILLQIEKSNGEGNYRVPTPKGYSAEETNYHLRLLLDVDFIEGRVTTAFQGTTIHVNRMTWDGHDFLEAIRPPRVWDQVQKRVRELGSAGFDVVKGLALQEIQKLLP